MLIRTFYSMIGKSGLVFQAQLPHAVGVIQKGDHIYFIGICGTAMASCAGALKSRGFRVSGSDANVYPPMSTFLAQAGIQVHEGYEAGHLDEKPDWIVIGNALSRGNPEVEDVLAKKWRYCSLPEILKECFIREKRSIVVAGTHGKTTTTSMVAWILECAGLNPSFLIGGLPGNFQRGARLTNSDWIVLEGDEYDTAFFDKRSKFVHYLPEIAIINNLEFDHADIFDNLLAVQKTFSHLIRLVPSNGLLLANGADKNIAPLLNVDFCPVKRFGLKGDLDFQVESSHTNKGTLHFNVNGEEYQLPMIGEHNLENAVAAIACAHQCGIPQSVIEGAMRTFKGVKRRLEIIGTPGGITVIDDFAHHPTAIKKIIQTLKNAYPDGRLWVLFEPRSNTTRRSIFQKELTDAFSDADVALFGEVARGHLLKSDDRLDLPSIVSTMNGNGKTARIIAEADDMAKEVANHARSGDVVAILSNGAFGGVHEKILVALSDASA
jgi:UDP-N-acetylmuramate: L-alanyl-gamma-D-glutamyl-meso-diaminopimelate ligase